MVEGNGYGLLIAAASSLTGTEIFDADTEPLDEEIAHFVSANSETLAGARCALRQPCAVPLKYDWAFFKKQADSYTALRQLARGFAAELRVCQQHGELSTALARGVNILELANATRRGGLVVDALVAIAFEGIAIDRTRRIRHRLKPEDASRFAGELLRLDAQREPFADVLVRERKWDKEVGDTEDETEQDSPAGTDDDEPELDAATRQAFKNMDQSAAEVPSDELHEPARKSDNRRAKETSAWTRSTTRGLREDSWHAASPSFAVFCGASGMGSSSAWRHWQSQWHTYIGSLQCCTHWQSQWHYKYSTWSIMSCDSTT